ncbi:hypothetical protein ACFX15_023595 [Malus domestica]
MKLNDTNLSRLMMIMAPHHLLIGFRDEFGHMKQDFRDLNLISLELTKTISTSVKRFRVIMVGDTEAAIIHPFLN